RTSGRPFLLLLPERLPQSRGAIDRRKSDRTKILERPRTHIPHLSCLPAEALNEGGATRHSPGRRRGERAGVRADFLRAPQGPIMKLLIVDDSAAMRRCICD